MEAADRVLARSPALARKILERHSFRVDGCVNSGLDIAPVAMRERSGDAPLRIVTACVLIKLKNIHAVLCALAELKKMGILFEYDILGDGPERASLERLRDELGLRGCVRFHGFVDRSEALRVMRSSDVFAMPSAPETFGLAYLEAMASGCVVIGHCNEGVDGIIEHQSSGILAQDASVPAVLAALLEYVQGDRHRLHRQALDVARAHTLQKAALDYFCMTGWRDEGI